MMYLNNFTTIGKIGKESLNYLTSAREIYMESGPKETKLIKKEVATPAETMAKGIFTRRYMENFSLVTILM